MRLLSSKVGVSHIFKMHIGTLSSSNERVSWGDIFTFYGIPLIPAVVLFYFDYRMDSSLNSLVITFGAIFSALLLSVLVLIYDQEKKIKEDQSEQSVSDLGQPTYRIKKKIISDLYHNLCYAILMSVAIIMFALINQILPTDRSFNCVGVILSLAVIFIIINIMLTIIMIVKRMHALLHSKSSDEQV